MNSNLVRVAIAGAITFFAVTAFAQVTQLGADDTLMCEPSSAVQNVTHE